MSGLRMLEVLKRKMTSGMGQTITMSIVREMETRLKMIVRNKEGKITVLEAAESSIQIMIQRCFPRSERNITLCAFHGKRSLGGCSRKVSGRPDVRSVLIERNENGVRQWAHSFNSTAVITIGLRDVVRARCCLLIAIDDASGSVMLRFTKEEDTASVPFLSSGIDTFNTEAFLRKSTQMAVRSILTPKILNV
jgi:hypothetical protein